MSNSGVPSILNLPSLKGETIDALKTLYADQHETIEHLARFGNEFERVAAVLVLNVVKEGAV